jgi:soluble lytic murein transglycosylase
MFISSNILIKYILLFCNIFTLCFALHTTELLANTDEKDKNTKLVLEIISLVENNKLQKINKLLAKNSDINLDDLVNWLMISNKRIDEKNIERTIKKYENWPDINNLIIHLEEITEWEQIDNILYKIYETQKPISRIGKIKYANFLINNNSNNIDQENIIIKSWVNGSFKKDDETYIYKKFSNLFDEKYNILRLDNLILEKKWSSAYRQVKRVSKEYQILAKAKIKLSRKEYGVDYAIRIIPEDLKNDSGLVYERVKWRRTNGLTDESYQLLLNYLNENSKNLVKPSYWWKEINWHARNLLNQKKYEQAYQLLNNHQQTKISNIANAEWLLGWISL